MFNSSSLLGSVHEDVLSATPENDEQALALVEEIKSRARYLSLSIYLSIDLEGGMSWMTVQVMHG